MASTLKFGTDNAVSGSTFSMLTGTENAQFPLTNIAAAFTTKVFRSTGTSCVVQIDFGQNVTIDTVMMVGNNLTGLGVTAATIEFSPTTSFPGTTIETIALNADHNFGFVLVTQASYRYAKLTLTGTSYCEVSNLYVGARTEIANNNIDTQSFEYTIQENFKSKSNNYGQLFIDQYNTSNTLSGVIKYVNTTEFDQLNNMYLEVKNTTPIWVMIDSGSFLGTDTEYLFSGYFYMAGKLAWQTVAPSLYDTKLSFIEVI